MSFGTAVLLVLLQFVFVFINAFFAASELAVMQLTPTRLRRQIEEGDKKAERILKMVESPSVFLSTIQIAITLAGYLGAAFAADNFAEPIANWLYYGLNFQVLAYGVLNTLVVVLLTIVLAYFTLVLGELVPKQIALARPYEVAKLASGVIAGLAKVLKPAIRLISASTRGVLRLFGLTDTRDEEPVTEDEIRMMVDASQETGNIDANEREMIENVFELNNTLARDVMTHRVDVVAIEADAEIQEILDIIESSGMSRFPVYDDSLDNVLGVLNARTYLLNLRRREPKTVRELLRPACFVPETVQANVLLRDMQTRKDHLAIVLDEYGGFSGLVSLEDLIEEIVGNIYDEFDSPEEPEIQEIGENLWRVAGDIDIDVLADRLDVDLPADREFDTLGGLVFSTLSSIPADGQRVTVEACGLHVETEPVIDHAVEWASVSVLPEPEPPVEDEGDKKERRRDRDKDKNEEMQE